MALVEIKSVIDAILALRQWEHLARTQLALPQGPDSSSPQLTFPMTGRQMFKSEGSGVKVMAKRNLAVMLVVFGCKQLDGWLLWK